MITQVKITRFDSDNTDIILWRDTMLFTSHAVALECIDDYISRMGDIEQVTRDSHIFAAPTDRSVMVWCKRGSYSFFVETVDPVAKPGKRNRIVQVVENHCLFEDEVFGSLTI